MIARTRLIDDLVQAAGAQGCDCVVNLAAGLDTRPYRLALPNSLRWIEADLPGLIEEKEQLLADAKPRCQLRRIKVDLMDAGARVVALRDAVTPFAQALVITEGLLVYLDDAQVNDLSRDLAALAGVRYWIIDLGSPAILEMMRKGMGAHFTNAPLKFAPANGIAFFEALGWRVAQVHSIFHAAVRFRRLPWFLKLFALLPEPNPRKLGRRAGQASCSLCGPNSTRWRRTQAQRARRHAGLVRPRRGALDLRVVRLPLCGFRCAKDHAISSNFFSASSRMRDSRTSTVG
jgi:methyltransferase (TIGR00027 family)